MYNLYLVSDRWAEKKKLIYLRDSNLCQHCGAPGQHVHHLRYDTLFDEPLDHLLLLCIPCHAKEGADKMPEGNGGNRKTYGKRHECADCGKLIPSQYSRCVGCKDKLADVYTSRARAHEEQFKADIDREMEAFITGDRPVEKAYGTKAQNPVWKNKTSAPPPL